MAAPLTKPNTPMPQNGIRRILSNSVLGEFGYDVDFDRTSHHSGRVVVIYAENGMGKTNFLKAVHHLLSPRRESLQALADLFVEEITVNLSDGSSVRLLPAGDASFLFGCRIESASLEEAVELWVRQEDVDARAFRRSSRVDVARYLDALRSLVSPTVFVGDDRLIYSATESRNFVAHSTFEIEQDALRRVGRPTQSVRDVLDLVEREFTQRALRTVSNDDTDSGEGVYFAVTRRVLQGENRTILAGEARESLLVQAEQVLAGAADFEKYELLSFSQIRRITEMIQDSRANSSHFRSLHGILGPYLSSTADRMKTLAETQSLIDTFVTSVNRFFERKRLHYTTNAGISLTGNDGAELEPDNLSSGEKHLLLLLSHAVLARSTGALVVIDEPELSLGLRWQRQLLPELLRCTEGSGVQFLVASHSVQIMGDVDDVVRPTEAL